MFISIGRGAVVDEDALAKALAAGSIHGAALDVFDKVSHHAEVNI